MIVWMEISEDKYELPLAIADSASDLAAICKTNTNNVSSHYSKYKNNKKKFSRFIKVVIDDD